MMRHPSVARASPSFPARARHVGGFVACLVASSFPPAVRSFSAVVGSPIRILGYGDSLTAGWHDGGMTLTPYAPKLEAGLNKILKQPVMVRHKGLPGWTAESMIEAKDAEGVGLRAILRKAIASVSTDKDPRTALAACVIIAGSNDLAYSDSADLILESVLGLHDIAHKEGIPTISVDIPPSAAALNIGWLGDARAKVNKRLGELAVGDKMRAHVSCPVKFAGPGMPGEELWESDGLHMSGLGYEALGEGLAPLVAGALQNWSIV